MLRTHINAISYLPLLIPLTTNLFNKQPIWCSRLYRSNSDNNCTRLWRCTASIIENIKTTLSILINYGEVHDVSCSFLIKYCFSAWYMDDYVSSMAPSVLFFRLFVPSWKCYAHLRPQLAKTLFTCGIYEPNDRLLNYFIEKKMVFFQLQTSVQELLIRVQTVKGFFFIHLRRPDAQQLHHQICLKFSDMICWAIKYYLIKEQFIYYTFWI